MKSTALPLELQKLQEEIRVYAVDAGLDFFEVIFEMLDWNQINMVASYGGFPNRYPHWRFGMEYERLSKSYAYGLSKIYEMVINNDPCYAYLLHSNNVVDQKMVMAHVYGHSDFFKNNVYFSNTNRKMMDEMANHRTRITRFVDRYGMDLIESFIDSCLSIENLIDYNLLIAPRSAKTAQEPATEVPRIKTKPYMEKYVNPPEFMESQKQQMAEEAKAMERIPPKPEKDVMGFLLEYAPLEHWERDTLSTIREEAYYFAPQGQTKILNEGWASFHHSKIMTEKALKPSEFIDYADHHSGTVSMQPGQLNPYKIGIELLRDIEERWNKGQFGKEYNDCINMRARKEWDRKLGLGREKIFEVRKVYNDVMFIDEFLTPEFCAKHKFFVFAFNVSADRYEIATREFEKIKRQMLCQLTNFGYPVIHVVDGNYKNRNELMLKHAHEGVDLKIDWAKEVLKALYRIWKRPVHIDTVLDGAPKILSFDGTEHHESRGA
ncbi:MAG: SpoVR family protein, partial [Deltaproteobacteria bacterium]|nr:SpoVR family protein [Deltaproteobacteria bacterium]